MLVNFKVFIDIIFQTGIATLSNIRELGLLHLAAKGLNIMAPMGAFLCDYMQSRSLFFGQCSHSGNPGHSIPDILPTAGYSLELGGNRSDLLQMREHETV